MRRATNISARLLAHLGISIHALHEEGDTWEVATKAFVKCISIHALHEEGDTGAGLPTKPADDFYPRPP